MISNKSRNPKPKTIELIIPKILVVIGIFSSILFLSWLMDKSLRQYNLIYVLIVVAFTYKVFVYIAEWLLIWHPSVPKKPEWTKKYSVDVLTTYVQGEPKEMVKKSLLAIKSMKYPHETFLCDEADDPDLKRFCKLHNIHHVTREKKIDAKAGNINNALETVAKGEVVLILDPDHIVNPNFLDEVLPYFEDERIGFVQVAQTYYNQYETVIAKAAAEQTYQFYGPLMMTLNSYGAAPAIGANCTFRRAALDSIGGHAPGLTEDMHTTLKLKAKGWKSVYNPVIVAKGLAPWNYSGYCLQQQKWSRGTFDLLYNVFPKVAGKLSWPQKLAFLAVPFFYLSGIMALIDFFLPVIALVLGIVPVNLNVYEFIVYYFLLYFATQIIRYYHQRWYFEAHEKGTAMLGGILFKASWWAPLVGFIFSLLNKKIPYIPTPKDFKLETPWKLLLPNISIIILSLFAIIYGLIRDLTPFSLFMAFLALLNILILSFGCLMAMQKQIVFLHSLSRGSFISKGSSTRKFIFKVKLLIYNFLNSNFIAASSLLFMLLFIIATFKMTPSNLPKYFSSEFIVRKISTIIGEENTLIDNKIYGQFYVGKNYQVNMKYNQTHVSFIKGNFHLNKVNKLSIDHFLDSCYSNNILPYLSLSIDTTNEKSIPDENNILTLKHIFKGVKKRYLPLFLMFDGSVNNVPDEFYYDFYNTAYLMADSMAINQIITWVWHSNEINKDEYLINHILKSRVNWIYSEKDSAFIYKDKYYGITHQDLKLPLLVNNSNVKLLNKDDFEKNKHVRNIVGILGAKSNNLNELDYNIKAIFKKPAKQEVNRLSLPRYIKGVAYNPGQGDGNSVFLPPTIKKLNRDFELIKNMGCNTIRRFAASIYDNNLLKTANKFELDVLYGFWFNRRVDYYKDLKKLEKRKKQVVRNVQKHNKDSAIISWGLGNETWTNFSYIYGQPYLSVVRNSYLSFINDLVNEIRQIDSNRPLHTVEIQNSASMHAFAEFVPQLDFFGINSYYEENISRLKELTQRNLNGIPYLVAEYGNKGYWSEEFNDVNEDERVLEQSSMQKAKDYETNWNQYILSDRKNNLGGVAFCWQDRYEYTATWFGILDIFGNKKPAYYALKNAYLSNPQHDWAHQFPIPEFEIVINYNNDIMNKAYAKTKAKMEGELDNYQYKWIIYTDFTLDKIIETEFDYGKNIFSFNIPKDEKPYRIYLYVKDNSGNIITESCPLGP